MRRVDAAGPGPPVRRGLGDDTVPEANAQHCQQALQREGSRVPLVELGAVDHDVSDVVALPQILAWFRHWLTS